MYGNGGSNKGMSLASFGMTEPWLIQGTVETCGAA
jgi:hypothetical protein